MALALPSSTEPEDTAVPARDAGSNTVPAAFRAKASPAKRKSSLLSVAVMALVVPGLFATVALPAYAFSPEEDSTAAEATVELQNLKSSNAQSVEVDDAAAATAVSRDAFAATSAAEMQRAAIAAAYSAYSGPSAADFLLNPPYPNFDLGQVANVALQYQGVPYAYGGADPSGFDCSGLVLFVYAQFGISLPHSVSGIAAMGTPIAREAALPGDIVTMSGHNGIYLGNGTFIDAPSAGRSVVVRPIYTDDYYIVRIGI